MLDPLWHYGRVIPRKPAIPNNRANLPLQTLLGSQFVTPKFPKSVEEPSIKTWKTPGKGVEGQSVTGGANNPHLVQRGITRLS
jgi:hypothetical protein